MPNIHIELYPGRTHQQKADLARAVTKAVVEIANANPESTHIIFTEVPKSHWAHAGILASDA